MTNIINASDKFERKMQENEFKEFKKFFMSMFGNLNYSEKKELLEIMQRGDKEEYLAFTRPIVMRETIRQFNKSNM